MWSRRLRTNSYPQIQQAQQVQPQQAPTPQAYMPKRIGMSGVHKDMSGRPIYSSQRVGIRSQPGQSWLHQRTMAAPQGSTLLKSRQGLFSEMQKAGSAGLTQDMRNRAAQMGVTESGWARATRRLPQSPLQLPQTA